MMKREYTGIIGEEMARKAARRRNAALFLTSFAVSHAVTKCAVTSLREKQAEEQARRQAEQDAYVADMMSRFKRVKIEVK